MELDIKKQVNMAISSLDRYRILSNIVAQMGTDNVDLYAELAKAEGTINLLDTQKAMATSVNNAQVTQPSVTQGSVTPPNVQPM